MRRVAVFSVKYNKAFVYITNNFEMTAVEIAAIYENRWQIETFFKKLNQNFPLTYFFGDNANAIEIQIWCALIALLLLDVTTKRITLKWHSLFWQPSSGCILWTILTCLKSLTLINWKERELKVPPTPMWLLKKQYPLLCKWNLKCSAIQAYSKQKLYFVRLSDNNIC